MLLVSLAAPATLTQLLTTAWVLPTGWSSTWPNLTYTIIFKWDAHQKRQAMDILAALPHLKTLDVKNFVLLRRGIKHQRRQCWLKLQSWQIAISWAKSLKMYNRGLFYPKLGFLLIWRMKHPKNLWKGVECPLPGRKMSIASEEKSPIIKGCQGHRVLLDYFSKIAKGTIWLFLISLAMEVQSFADFFEIWQIQNVTCRFFQEEGNTHKICTLRFQTKLLFCFSAWGFI